MSERIKATALDENVNIEGEYQMKNRKWLLEVGLEKGTGVNQVKVGELMNGGKTDDECKEIISTLLEAGETKEYTENVFLRLGEFEGATKEEAFNNYFESFNGDDQNELFFMHQINAVELSVECGCGGNCSNNAREAKALIESMSDEQVSQYIDGEIDRHGNKIRGDFTFTVDDGKLEDTIGSKNLYVQEKVAVWKETRYRLRDSDTLETVKDSLVKGSWSEEWTAENSEYIENTEDYISGGSTIEVYDRNGGKLGGN